MQGLHLPVDPPRAGSLLPWAACAIEVAMLLHGFLRVPRWSGLVATQTKYTPLKLH
jgi:hypothetical protein